MSVSARPRSGPGVLPGIVTGVGVVVISAGVGLALVSHHSAPAHSSPVSASLEAPTASSTPSAVPVSPVPDSIAGPACWMFCNEPPLPPADAHGCPLFCDLSRPTTGGVQ
ncbi:hypothetical protein [Nocardia sp. alder85J]|uniref:hypothetical protein n=1 Tax=Nocardia sp. alder85J TaxID=2862949 RepID=UPI00225ADA75|nr:hypothetical protein [Nocardia sp. alder85J]MCX4093664.1 hypothetical protein [Nocardia sp. alder85J]